MEPNFLDKVIVRDYFDDESSRLFNYEKPELVMKVKELNKENRSLRESKNELEKTYKEMIATLAREIETLKLKVKEMDPSPRSHNSQHNLEKEDTGAGSHDDSMSSKEDEKEHERSMSFPLSNGDEEEKNNNKKKMLAMVRDMKKSPSIILKDQDAQYYDNPHNMRKPSVEQYESKVWQKDILPFIKDKEQRDKTIFKIKATLTQEFIPGKYRCTIWPLLIGNPLKMKRKIYDQLCKSMEMFPVEDKIKNIIKEDLTRTYPQLKSFNRGEALNDELQYLLELFHFARPDVGYVQGMTYPASMLLLHMDRYHAFKCMANLMIYRPFLNHLYKFKMEEVQVVCRAFEKLLKQKLPMVQKHMERNKITAEVYLIEWFITLFCRNFHMYDTAKIWDLFMLEGEVALIKVALKIFTIIEPELLEKEYAETLYFLRSCTSDIDSTLLLRSILNTSLTPEKWAKSCEKEKDRKKKKEPGIRNIFH